MKKSCLRLIYKQILVVLLSFCVSGWAVSSVTTKSVTFNNLNHPELESLDGIFAIAQDKQGYMWFAGKNGLRRYDGYKIDVFRHDIEDDTSISSNDINDLLVDKQGRLWIALLSGGGLNQFDYKTQSFIRYEKKASDANSIGSADIYSLAEDGNGDLWMSTNDNGLNRLEHQTGHFHRYPVFLPGTENAGIRDLAIDSIGNIWVASNGHGLYKFNKNRDQFIRYSQDSNNDTSISSNKLYRVYIDTYENIWLGTQDGGLDKFDPVTESFIHYKNDSDDNQTIGAGRVWDIAEDINGNLWVATEDSLNRFNKWQNVFEQFSVNHYGINTLSGSTIRMFLDGAGDFWLGSQLSKIDRITERGTNFKVTSHSPKTINSLSDLVVNAIVEDKNKNIWVGTEKGLTKMSPDTKTFDRYYYEPNNKNSLDSNNIQNLMVDASNQLWIKTDKSMYTFNIDKKIFNKKNKNLSRFISDTNIRDIKQDKNGIIWFATEGKGLVKYNPKNKKIKNFVDSESNKNSISHRFIWSIYEDKKGNLWVGTLWGLNKMDRENEVFKKYYFSKNENSLANNSVRAITEDKQGNIWLGTNSGLSKLDQQEEVFENYRVKDGLPDDNVTSVLVDSNGYIWVTHQKGISRFDKKNKTFKNYDKRHGIASNSYPGKAAALIKSDGDIIFASARGLTTVEPLDLIENTIIPPVVLTGLLVNNEPQKIGPEKVLTQHISLTDTLTLSHKNNNFSIEFSALNYHLPALNQYQYKLVGFDDKWHKANSMQRLASYTNLNPGSYTFLVKGSNNEGVWNESPTQIKINIVEPWWLTPLAIMSYYLAFIIIGVVSLNVWQKQYDKNKAIKKRLSYVDKLKQQFLSNFSKEITLPISTIKGLSENLLIDDSGISSEKSRQHITLIHENSQQLETLIQDMLDFSSFNDEANKLNLRLIFLEPILEGIIKWFQPQAESKALKLYLTIEGELPKIEADYSCIQKILFNIIENAIKHTEHGYVDVIARQVEENILIQIADTGTGIDNSKHEAIFGNDEKPDGESDTVGLSHTKKLVELHGGAIHVESTSDKGSMFVIHLPISHSENINNDENLS